MQFYLLEYRNMAAENYMKIDLQRKYELYTSFKHKLINYRVTQCIGVPCCMRVSSTHLLIGLAVLFKGLSFLARGLVVRPTGLVARYGELARYGLADLLTSNRDPFPKCFVVIGLAVLFLGLSEPYLVYVSFFVAFDVEYAESVTS